jgi:hypothetical membrane protein
MSPQRISAICGVLAPTWFVIALVVVAAVRPEYSHLTKAASELGAVGAPNALAWNILGFGAVGALVAVLAWSLWQQGGGRVAALLIAISGIGFAAAGVFPADMNDMNADTTRLHILASLVSFAAFAVAVPVVGWGLWQSDRRGFAVAAIIFGLAAVLSVLLREANIPPRLAQRINFVAYLVWIALVAVSVVGIREPTQKSAVP